MSSMPECTKCGAYVHHGPVLCLDCELKAAEKYSELLDLADDMAEAISSNDKQASIKAMQNYYAKITTKG